MPRGACGQPERPPRRGDSIPATDRGGATLGRRARPRRPITSPDSSHPPHAAPQGDTTMRRLALPLILLALSSLAFAPAPLPKSQRQARPAGPSMEGLWRRGLGLGGDTVRI